ncbi:Hpt domain-containing protein [Vibrio harveyi]|nr:Hpt domain-containing protein [Vibrio harveyi]
MVEWIEKFRKQDAKEIANVFKSSMTHDVANLKAAASKQDKKRIIHGIKGALGAIGVTILAELCIEAESRPVMVSLKFMSPTLLSA